MDMDMLRGLWTCQATVPRRSTHPPAVIDRAASAASSSPAATARGLGLPPPPPPRKNSNAVAVDKFAVAPHPRGLEKYMAGVADQFGPRCELVARPSRSRSSRSNG